MSAQEDLTYPSSHHQLSISQQMDRHSFRWNWRIIQWNLLDVISWSTSSVWEGFDIALPKAEYLTRFCGGNKLSFSNDVKSMIVDFLNDYCLKYWQSNGVNEGKARYAKYMETRFPHFGHGNCDCHLWSTSNIQQIYSSSKYCTCFNTKVNQSNNQLMSKEKLKAQSNQAISCVQAWISVTTTKVKILLRGMTKLYSQR